MDFLDSIDETPHPHDRKTDRMRSWYMYEQYRNLEQHQLDAAEQLRNRSMQERLLHQELEERRVRRSLLDQVSVNHSEPNTNRSQATCLSSTNDDFYESFCEVLDFETDNPSHHGSENTYMEDFKILEEFQEDTSCANSSVLDVEKDTNKSAPRTIADNIKLQLKTVKDNMVSLERYARMDDEKSVTSLDSLGWPKRSKVLRENVDENQWFYMWSRLVAFAYHIIQFNHGNCYYDYSSQVLTAVLACDVLRRGLNRMCDILQYYVSPVKFASDSEGGSTVYNRKPKKRKSYLSKKNKLNLSQNASKRFEKKHKLGSSGQCYATHSSANKIRQNRIGSHVKRRHWRRSERSGSSTLWPEELEDCDYDDQCIANPMLKLVRYLDDVLYNDLEDFVYT